MTSEPLSYEELRDWAADRATDWALDADGSDRLAVGDLHPAWPLRIEVFNLLMPLIGAAVGGGTEFGTTGLRGQLKRSGVDRAARLAMIRALGIVHRPASAAPAHIAFLSELATPSGLEPMLAVAAALPVGSYRPISADPRATRAWRRAGADALPIAAPYPEEWRAHRRVARRIGVRWQAILDRPPDLRLAGTDLRAPILDRLGPLVRRSVPWLAVERLGLARLLDAVRPAWLVLASDQHRVGRIAVELARERGIRTLVLQHGLPQYRLGYLPVIADEIATWSATSDAWFLEGGADSDRLVRLGNPRLDTLWRLDRARHRNLVAARFPELSAGPNLLLALSPNQPSRNLAIVELALGWVAAEPEGRLVVKLHPGDGRWDEIRARIRRDPHRLRVLVAHREPLYPLLTWADLVVLHRSTVAVEALAAGTPVAVASTPGASSDDALPDGLRLPNVVDPADLADTIRSVRADQARREFLETRRAAAEATTGPLDGRSAERIANHLLRGQPG